MIAAAAMTLADARAWTTAHPQPPAQPGEDADGDRVA